MRPIQPISKTENGIIRFEENKIVSHLLEHASKYGCDLNALACQDFPQEDWEQFAQLIGYSVSGWGSLGYVRGETYEAATRMAEEGKTEDQARIESLTHQLNAIKRALRQPVADLFEVHPDDLKM